MEIGRLSQEEFEKRCTEVFETQEDEEYYLIYINDNNQVCIEMCEVEPKTGCWVCFEYNPNMEDRPEALDYLMGKRNDFND